MWKELHTSNHHASKPDRVTEQHWLCYHVLLNLHIIHSRPCKSRIPVFLVCLLAPLKFNVKCMSKTDLKWKCFHSPCPKSNTEAKLPICWLVFNTQTCSQSFHSNLLKMTLQKIQLLLQGMHVLTHRKFIVAFFF